MNEPSKVAVKINDYTIILIDQGRDKSDAKETFIRRWQESQKIHENSEPFLNN